MTDTRTLAYRYNHGPGSFNALIDAYEIAGEPELTMIVRRVCRERSVRPSQLQQGSLRRGYVTVARRLIWRAAYERTDLSIENIADLFGYAAGTVRPWATSWNLFEKEDPEWWSFWGLALADSIGVPLEDA